MSSGLVDESANAGSVSFESISLERAATVSKRIVVAAVTARSSFHFPGSAEYAAQPKGQSLAYVQVTVRRVLKGAAIAPGEELRIFSAAAWFEHTHAAAIAGGVVSYADPHYAGHVPADAVKEGATLIFFLDDAPAPAGFPRGAVFMAFGESYDRADREKDVVAAVKDGPFAELDRPTLLKTGAPVRFSDHLTLELTGHWHKRPALGGPRRETAGVRIAKGGKSALLELAHIVMPDETEIWATETWGDYSIELRGPLDDAQATVVVRRLRAAP